MAKSTGRGLVAIIFIPLLIYIMLKGEFLFYTFVEVVIGFSLYEFYTMMESKKIQVNKKIGLGIGLLVPWIYYLEVVKDYKGVSPTSIGMAIMIILFITIQVVPGNIEKASQKISYTIFGILYIPFMFSHIMEFKHFEGVDINLFGLIVKEGRMWLLTIFLLIWASDSAAYFFGKKFGKRKLNEKISPKKSVEGGVAGLFAPIISMIILKVLFFTTLSLVNAIGIGFLVGILGQIGDLGESLFKREFETKDSGNILKGHGGMLDRFDSLLFAMPAVVYYIKIFVQ